MRLWLVFLVVINNFRGGKYTRQRYTVHKINNQLHAEIREYYFPPNPICKATFGFDIFKFEI